MPVSPTYPGVYIEELPSGVRTIIGVATSITAFLGRTEAGPTNIGVTLTRFGDFERTFGELDPRYPVSYAVSDFFANGGSQAVVVRLFSDVGAAAAAAVAKAAEDNADPDPAAVAAAAHTKATTFADEPAKSAAAKVDKAATDEAAKPNPTADKVKIAARAAADAITDTSSAVYEPNEHFKLKAAGPGEWGNKLYVSVDKDGITDDVGKRYGLSSGGPLFNLNVYNGPTLDASNNPTQSPDERIQNVSLYSGAGERRLDRVLNKLSNLIKSSVTTFIPKEADAQGNTVPIPEADLKKLNPFAGGSNSSPLTTEDYLGSELKKTGMHGLDDVDLFNILCLPPDTRGGETLPAVYDGALKYCVDRRAILIVDPPTAWVNRVLLLNAPAVRLSTDVKLSGTAARNAFLYYPRVQMPDPKLGGAVETFPACGIVAGIFARTDTQRGVWVAPAGLDASLGAATPEISLTDRENGILNPLAINCLRSFPVAGSVLWGARTLRGADQLADEYKYLPVRRTALFIEESLYRGTQWVVFQPNDEPLWALIRLNVGAFMNDLFRKGAFQGSKPQDAYFVRCDHTTTTQNDIDRGVVNIVVGFAPLKPAEFVIIQLQQIAGQIQT
jgi:uncharacterized protein